MSKTQRHVANATWMIINAYMREEDHGTSLAPDGGLCEILEGIASEIGDWAEVLSPQERNVIVSRIVRTVT